MVDGKTDVEGSQGLIAGLAIPRPVSRALIWLVFLGLSQVAWVYLDTKLLAVLSAQGMSLCAMCLTAVWSLRDKASDLLGSMSLDSHELAAVTKLADELSTKSVPRAVWVALCFLMVGSTAAIAQLANSALQWVVLLGGVALAEAVYAFWITSHLTRELRAWRNLKQLEAQEEREHKSQLERLSASVPIGAYQGDASHLGPVGELKATP